MPAPTLQRPLIIPIFLPQLGCPHQCLFCNQASITGQADKLPSNAFIKSQIEHFLTYGRQQRAHIEISFYGGNFLGLNSQQILNLLTQVSSFIRAERVNGIRFSTRPDTITSQRLELIAAFPITTIELGVQSMNDRVLALSCRGHWAEDTRIAVSLLKQTSYDIGLQLMLGLPGDSIDSLMDSASQIAALRPNFVRIYPTLVLKNSPLARWYHSGKYMPLSLAQAIEQAKRLFLLFHRHKVAVIRMGLQASAELNQKETVLAGPYHPAFGHMVWSAIYLDSMRRLISGKPQNSSSVRIHANPRDISKVRGLKNCNLKLVKKEFNLSKIKIFADPELPAATLALNNDRKWTSVFD